MKKTFLLSLVMCGASGLAFTGCTDKGEDAGTTASTVADNGDAMDENTEMMETNEEVGDGDGDGDGDGGESLSFIPMDDDLIVESECDPFLQDCPEGQKCVPYSSSGGTWDANKCVEITGSGAAGDECTYGGTLEATDDCDADTHCWDVMNIDGVLVGVCTEFCKGTPDDPICPPNTACLIANDGSINLCIRTCDPLLQDCGDGLGCFWANTQFNCIFTTSDIPEGEPCGYINDCAPGNLCADASVLDGCGGAACCTGWCSLSDPICTNPAHECVSFFEEGLAPPGYEDVGVCILPGA